MSDPKYLPVHPDFYDILEKECTKPLKVFFFESEETIGEAKGSFNELLTSKKGEFLQLEDGSEVRLDRIITINGKPGPAFEEYDNYANACLTCMAGYEEDL